MVTSEHTGFRGQNSPFWGLSEALAEHLIGTTTPGFYWGKPGLRPLFMFFSYVCAYAKKHGMTSKPGWNPVGDGPNV
jgi:hypothetical protein